MSSLFLRATMRFGTTGQSTRAASRSIIEVLEARIAPAVIFVTTLSDAGDGSLREAIEQANDADGADTIKFKVKGEILLESALPSITDALTIKGKGSTKTIIDGADAYRVLEIDSANAINVSISGVTLENGRAEGYGGALAIFNEGGKVLITKSVIQDSFAVGNLTGTGTGGGIWNGNSQLILSKSVVTGNKAIGGNGLDGANGANGIMATPAGDGTSGSQGALGSGGGIFNGVLGTLTVLKSTIDGNTAQGGNGGRGGQGGNHPTGEGGDGGNGAEGGHAFGGGIENRGKLLVQQSTISGNTVIGGLGGDGGDSGIGGGYSYDEGGSGGYGGDAMGGGISSDGLLNLSRSSVSGNQAIGGGGGYRGDGYYNGYNGDAGRSHGGGVAVSYSAASIEKTVITGNKADRGGGISTEASKLLITKSLVTDNQASRGGGIFVTDGETHVVNTTVDGNTASINGGGIESRGELEVMKSRITGNTAGISAAGEIYAGARGGGIAVSDDEARITDSVISSNKSHGIGGGLHVEDGELQVNRSVISFNTADGDGGGISNYDGYLGLFDSSVTKNDSGDDGGGIVLLNDGFSAIERSLISSNTAEDDGGGISTSGYSVLFIRDSTISGNTAGQSGGGVANTGQEYYDAYYGYTYGSSTVIERSTISGNDAAVDGGGIFHTGGELDVVSSTIAFNTATRGGGLSTVAAMDIIASTIARNSAREAGGGIWADDGLADAVFVASTIVADNTAPLGTDVLGPIAVEFSLIENTDGAVLDGPNYLSGVDPLLGPLKKNGGFTLTMAPKPKSVVIDAGYLYGEMYDQTGDLRIRGAGIDIGAVEVR